MIKANLGSIQVEEKSLLVGVNHLIVSYPMAEGSKGLTAGTLVKLEKTQVHHITENDDPIGILAQTIETEASKNEVAQVIVFGAVKRDKLTFTDQATPVRESLVEKLRKNGIYAVN